MKRMMTVGMLTAMAIALPITAQAQDGGSGSRQQAGGGFMSSYVDDPYHDPRSLHSQRMGTGQILGAPMLSENAGRRRPLGGAPGCGRTALGRRHRAAARPLGSQPAASLAPRGRPRSSATPGPVARPGRPDTPNSIVPALPSSQFLPRRGRPCA
jgi:hypothetical protein